MITNGIKEIDTNKFLLSQDAAKELIEELKYSVEEAKDHEMIRSFSAHIESKEGKFLHLIFEIQPK